MNGWEYLALTLELWTVVGVVGLTISVARRERQKLWQGIASLVGVWVIYMTVLFVVSYRQPGARVTMGHAACFDAMCFTAERVEEVTGFPVQNNARLVRVSVRVANQGKKAARENIQAYLLDAQGRRWEPSKAVSGNPLDAKILPGASVVSEPVFRLTGDATGLQMMLTHGRWSRHSFVIGDPESFGHRSRLMLLDR